MFTTRQAIEPRAVLNELRETVKFLTLEKPGNVHWVLVSRTPVEMPVAGGRGRLEETAHLQSVILRWFKRTRALTEESVSQEKKANQRTRQKMREINFSPVKNRKAPMDSGAINNPYYSFWMLIESP